MFRKFTALVALTVAGAGTAYASGPSEGDLALFHTGAFTNAQTYNIGYMFSNDLMGYGTVGFRRISPDSGSSTTSVRLGGGARFYLDILGNGNVGTFLDGYAEYVDDGITQRDGIAVVDDAFIIGGAFGAEVFLAPRLSVGARVTLLEYISFDNAGSTMGLGSTDVLLNIYFGT